MILPASSIVCTVTPQYQSLLMGCWNGQKRSDGGSLQAMNSSNGEALFAYYGAQDERQMGIDGIFASDVVDHSDHCATCLKLRRHTKVPETTVHPRSTETACIAVWDVDGPKNEKGAMQLEYVGCCAETHAAPKAMLQLRDEAVLVMFQRSRRRTGHPRLQPNRARSKTLRIATIWKTMITTTVTHGNPIHEGNLSAPICA